MGARKKGYGELTIARFCQKSYPMNALGEPDISVC